MKKLIIVVLVSILMFAGVSKANLVAHYEFESDANDSAGTNHGALYGNAHITNDPERGNVLSLDGNNDYMMAPDHPNLDFADEFTLAAWVKTNDIRDGRVIARYDPTSQDGYGLNQTDNNGGEWTFSTGVNGTGGFARSDNPPTMDWTHVLGIRDVSGKVTLYIDGVLQSDFEVNPGDINSTGNLLIGVDTAMQKDFSGLIDDVRIYNHALSSEEIAAVVPEPTTLLLLGLGGLVFRRKQ